MNYEQFILAMLGCVKDRISEEESVERREVLKNNGVRLIGISIRNVKAVIAPVIYMEEFYQKYCCGAKIEALAEQVIQCSRDFSPEQIKAYEDLRDFEKIRHRIVYKLINAEKNKKMLSRVPNLPILDFAIVFYVIVSVNETEEYSVMIKNDQMEMWNLPISLLYQYAKLNTPKLYPYRFMPLNSLMEEYYDMPIPESPLLILTNKKGMNGATAILYPNMPKIIYEYVGENYYLLPSSIHEFLIIPESEYVFEGNLKEIVRNVNADCISREEFLSDNVYYFNGNIITKM